MSTDFYQKVVRDKLYDQVADNVEDLIQTGKLRPGDRLPPERELAEQMGVARGVVREATKVLAERGLVTVEAGRGTFVTELNSSAVSNHLVRFLRFGNLSFQNLNELRQVLEVSIAELAALRASEDDVLELQQAIEKMDAALDSVEAYIEGDQEFHLALARATQNPLFPLLIEILVDQVQDSRRQIWRVPGSPQRGQKCHRLICDAVARKDATGARRAMVEHLDQVRQDGYFSTEKDAEPVA